MFKISITPTQQQRQSLRGRHGPRRRGGKRQVFNAVGRREPNACSCPTTRPTQAAAHAQRLISLVIYDPRTLAVPSGGWPRALAEIAATSVLQLVLFQLAEEIGFTGFLQHPWQDWYHPMKLTFYVALLWAVRHGHCPTAWQEPERSVALSAPVGKA